MYSRTFNNSMPRTLHSASRASQDNPDAINVNVCSYTLFSGNPSPVLSHFLSSTFFSLFHYLSLLMIDVFKVQMYSSRKDEPFDPLDFYSDDPIATEQSSTSAPPPLTSIGTDSPNPSINKQSKLSGSSLRRSVRPKPAAEALLSSPPAIKFYESTVIRKGDSAARSRAASLAKLKQPPQQQNQNHLTSSNDKNNNLTPFPISEPANLKLADSPTSKSQILRLRVSASTASSSLNSTRKGGAIDNSEKR